MSVAFESIDASQDICEGCEQLVDPSTHKCQLRKLLRARAKYPGIAARIRVSPLSPEEPCDDEETDSDDSDDDDVVELEVFS